MSESFKLKGKVKIVNEAQTFGSGFSAREFVLTVEDGKYPQEIPFRCVQDKVSLLDEVNAGDEAEVSFDVKGREYNGRYFCNLECWKIQVAGGRHGAPPTPGAEPYAGAMDDEDIPF